MKKQRVIIIGAAGRDFHNFNTMYRDNEMYEVVAFTAAQIPDIDGRKYPPSLAGKLYPDGIPIFDEADLEKLIKEYNVDECVLSYSDLPYDTVMHIGSRVMAAGAKFSMMGSYPTMIKSTKPVISICAVRTGCGKSQTTREVVRQLIAMGKKVVSVRHPMPYGDLEAQKVQRFASIEDLDKHNCTIEEMEEYEPHIAMGSVIYAGVDYEAILREAEKEADVIVWDGGNNDMPFYQPDLHIVVVDPLRPGHEISYYPGEVNLRMADVVVVNKVDSAYPEDIEEVLDNVRQYNPKAHIILAASSIMVENPDVIKGKNVLVVEDGPTLTHGEMDHGAGMVAARRYGAADFVDPRPYVVGKIAETFETYPEIGILLPAMGYGKQQMADLEATINNVECDSVVIGTPINLARFIKINKPNTRVYYELTEISAPKIADVLRDMPKLK
ncbi:MAG TPA: cyclic 2,3-diphosphoglycerate synthase [Candidatus Kapabacteria bacterium]|jgi:predicted GTPase|nr:cyclic 2,3-diphosphoglycerate synthase [Candidatus Kapabacteria bacterium]HOM03922.1 cyclic 2,3-diphosphoglycerate synthase [Candidatus Kapabacteria bacterium]HPP39669.1 cyclic 2,3-diphosphoglycerate synthase [Candidatus Kapabacteria bacterium]